MPGYMAIELRHDTHITTDIITSIEGMYLFCRNYVVGGDVSNHRVQRQLQIAVVLSVMNFLYIVTMSK